MQQTNLSTFNKALLMSESRYAYINGDKLHPRHQQLILAHRKSVSTLMKYSINDMKVIYEFDLKTVVSIEIESIEEVVPFAKSYNAWQLTTGEEGLHDIK
jgi:hypothetical protein